LESIQETEQGSPNSAGVARVLKGNDYALICDSGSENLWIVHRQRGTLAQYKDGEVELATGITPEDLANFSQIARSGTTATTSQAATKV
jgi:hypothetical protein